MGFFRDRLRSITFQGNWYKPFSLDNKKVNYELSRSMYGNVGIGRCLTPVYPFGSWCVKPYIDTLTSYVGIPAPALKNEDARKELEKFIKRNTSAIVTTQRATYIDACAYIRLSFEETVYGNQLMARSIPRDMVKNVIPDVNGEIGEITLEYELGWKDSTGADKECKVLEKINAKKIKTKYSGAIPPWIEGKFSEKEEEEANSFGIVPIIRFYNAKEPWMSDGRPEITAAIPFIDAYDKVMDRLLISIKNNATPKPWFSVSNINDFIRSTFGVEPDLLKSGKASVDLSKVGALFMPGSEDKAGYLQADSMASDMAKTLELLYYCIIDLTMPEYLYGTNMATSNASVKEQSPVWARKIIGKRQEVDSVFRKLFFTTLVMANKTKGVNIADDLDLEWPEATEKDETAFVTRLSSLATALSSLIDRKVIAPSSAFEAVKEYLPGLKEYFGKGGEGELAIRMALVTDRIEKLAIRLSDGDINTLSPETMNSLLADIRG
jgi:hypothetical protein